MNSKINELIGIPKDIFANMNQMSLAEKIQRENTSPYLLTQIDLREKMREIIDDTTLSNEEKVRLLSYLGEEKRLRSNIGNTIPEISSTRINTTADGSKVFENDQHENTLNALLPDAAKKKSRQLLTYMEKGNIKINEKGNIVIDDRTIPDTNALDILFHLLTAKRPGKKIPGGTNELITSLRNLNTPEMLIIDKTQRDKLNKTNPTNLRDYISEDKSKTPKKNKKQRGYGITTDKTQKLRFKEDLLFPIIKQNKKAKRRSHLNKNLKWKKF